MNPGRHEQVGTPFLAEHFVFGPHGDGWHNSSGMINRIVCFINQNAKKIFLLTLEECCSHCLQFFFSQNQFNVVQGNTPYILGRRIDQDQC